MPTYAEPKQKQHRATRAAGFLRKSGHALSASQPASAGAHAITQMQGRMNSSPGATQFKSLQSMVGRSSGDLAQLQTRMNRKAEPAPHSSKAPMQFKITMADGTVYNNPSQTPTVINHIEAEGEEWDKQLGRTLANFLSRGDHGPYDTYTDLLEDLRGRRGAGLRAQEEGKARERRVAATSGGEVADTGRYGQDEIKRIHGSARHVKLDTQGSGYYGIVGGPAKARNLEKFRGICRDLRAVSEQDGKEPRVYCTADTPVSVINAATAIVGAGNVYEVESGRVWSRRGGALQNAIRWVAANPGKTVLGLSAAALLAILTLYSRQE